MPRKPVWPPRVYWNKATDRDLIRVRGKDVYLGRHGSEEARREYARVVAELAANGGLPPAPSAGGVTVRELAARWEAHAALRYDPRGREPREFKLALEVVVALYGDLPAADFGTRCLEAVQLAMATGSWMSETLRTKRGKTHATDWCRNVVNRQIVRVRTVWRWAERQGLAPKGSWANLLTVPGLARNDRRVRHTVRRPPADFAHVKAAARKAKPVVGAMLLLQWWSGMRSAEVRTMRAGEVDRSGPVWLYRPARHKNSHRGQDRVVALGAKCQSLLRPWLDAAEKRPSAGPDSFVFPPHKGPGTKRDHYNAFGYAQAVRRAAKAAGVPAFSPYACRHAAKQRVTRELGLDAARAFLGQKSLDTTNGYGDQLDLKTAAETARRMG